MTARSGALERRTRFLPGFVAIGVVAILIAFPGEPASAKRIVGTKGADRIVGTAKPDRINARRGNDRVNGRRGSDRLNGSGGRDRLKGAKGRDWLSAGKGVDHLNAVDGKKDHAVNGGAGKDICTIDKADMSVLKHCDETRVMNPGGGGPNPGGGGARKCVAPQEAKLRASGESRGLSAQAGPTFSPAFFATTITLEADGDGLDGDGNLPISITAVCDVPRSLAREALQIAGGDGVAVLGPGTKVFQAGKLLEGQVATTAVAGADTVTVRARLKHPGQWGQDEDGKPIPTFTASRITITD